MLSGNNKIYTLDNLANPTTIKELINRHNIPVFTYTDKISVGWLDRVVLIGESRVYSIILDDDTFLSVSGDQKVIKLNGEVTHYNNLVQGDSLLPLYLSFDKHGYPYYRENSDHNLLGLTTIDRRRVRKIARMVAEYKISDRLSPGTYVFHIDENKTNCHPDNLTVEVKDAKNRKVMNPYIKALKEAREFIDSVKKNHKVKDIVPGGTEPVYGFVSDKLKNVAVSGIFVNIDDCE